MTAQHIFLKRLARCQHHAKRLWSKPSVRAVCRISAVLLLSFGVADLAYADDSGITSIGSDLWKTAQPMLNNLKWAGLAGVDGITLHRSIKTHNYGHLLWIPGVWLAWNKVMSLAASTVTS